MRHYLLPGTLLLLCLVLVPGCRKDSDDTPSEDVGQNNGWTLSWLGQHTTGVAVTPTCWLRSYISNNSSTFYLMARSTDQGATWTSWPTGTPICGMTFVSDSVGFTRCNNIMRRTEDGGHTWTTLATDPGEVVGVPGNPSRLFAIGHATTYTSIDTGLTWTPLGAEGPGDLVGVMDFVDGSIGYAAMPGALRRTIDGGVTWETVIEEPANSFSKVAHRDAMNGVALVTGPGSSSFLYHTTDAWATYSAVNPGLFGLIGLLRNDESGDLYAWHSLWLHHSSDLGTTWIQDLMFPPDEEIQGFLRSGDLLIAWSDGYMATKEVPL